ncbi:MAG: M1 family metallopeptidase [Hyphomonas sp.]
MSNLRLARAILGAASILSLAACGADPLLGRSEPQIVRLEEPPAGQLPTGVTPTVYRLNLVTDPSAPGFTGDVEIDITLDAPHARIWLHAQAMNVINAFARLPDGSEVPATFTGDQATGGVARLDFETPLPAGTATLVVDYEAPYNLALAGLYKVSQGGQDYLASQMQAIDARRMVPSFDEPRFKTPWAVTVMAPEGLKVITNGIEIEAVPADDGMVLHRFAPTRPIPSYLLALAVGPYDESELVWIETVSGIRPAPIPLRGFAAAGKGARLAEVLENTQPMMHWMENYFREAYPYGKLDLIAAPDYAWGAMENPGAIIYRESALLLDERSTLAQRRGVFTTHAHELAHQWFGNLVTPKWWNDIWLNESFATWMSYKTMQAVDPGGEWELSPIAAGLGAMRTDSLLSARQIRNPVILNTEIEDAFDSITYSKGGSVLNMFETWLGEEAFREGVRLHILRFADGVADVDDFMQSLAQGAGDEAITASFRSFILQPGIPMLDIKVACPDGGSGLISVYQSRYAPLGSQIDRQSASWQVPFSARLVTGETSETGQWMISGAGHDIKTDTCPDYVMPNAGGTGYWRSALDDTYAARLADNFSALTDGEQMVYVDSLIAGFEAGRVSGEALLAGLEASTSGSPAAISLPFAQIRAWHGRLDADGQSAFSAWIERTYGPVDARLRARPAASLSTRESLLKEAVGGLLLTVGDRETERAALARSAAAYLGFGRAPNQQALRAEQIGPAVGALIRAEGRPAIDTALAYVDASSNQPERTAILTAIAGNAEAETLAALIADLTESQISSSEYFTFLSSAMRAGLRGEAGVWDAFETHFDRVLARVPEIRRPQLASFAGMFCSAEAAGRAKAFFEAKAEQLPGLERNLAQGVERAELCAALARDALPSLAAALSE